jgi:hypothetical protein
MESFDNYGYPTLLGVVCLYYAKQSSRLKTRHLIGRLAFRSGESDFQAIKYGIIYRPVII